jgi:DNA-binding transcriptional ArsR family regulator
MASRTAEEDVATFELPQVECFARSNEGGMMARADADGNREMDVGRFAAVLEVLANENRLELLRQLRTPHTAREVNLAPPEVAAGENPTRPISRQAARMHLTKLAEIGVVVARPSRRGRAAADEYILNHQRLFAIAEEFRSLASLRAIDPPVSDRTLEGGPAGAGRGSHGACLVLVKGLDEGRNFKLGAPQHPPDESWVIGRRSGIPVCLDYDPYISAENAEVRTVGGRYLLRDLPLSRNGTYLNWERLPKGSTSELHTGDVIGVGRSLLMFRGG